MSTSKSTSIRRMNNIKCNETKLTKPEQDQIYSDKVNDHLPGKIDKKIWDSIQKGLKNVAENKDFRDKHEKSYKDMKAWVEMFIHQLNEVNDFYHDKMTYFEQEFIDLQYRYNERNNEIEKVGSDHSFDELQKHHLTHVQVIKDPETGLPMR